MRNFDRWTRRSDATKSEFEGLIDGRINRRAFLARASAVRAWNLAHPRDPVSIVGLDDQDNAPARETLTGFLA